MPESLRKQTISGVIWSAIERFSLQIIQFVINIIMARLLLPSDYGIIGMLAIFLQISQAFIDSGFAHALIQKKDRTETDYSTVFYFNIIIAFIFYVIIYFSAPLIAQFYNQPTLIPITRIIALNLIFSSFSAIHNTILTIRIDFKTQSKASLTAAIISGTLGITMAYLGFGVWALVFQSLLNSFLITLLLFFLLKWKPQFIFSFSSFKRLFSFGSRLLISGMIHTIYRNLYTIIIGRRFSATDLGFYTRAEQFAIFPSSNLNAIISRVTYPILSSIQDDDQRLSNAYRKYIQLASFIIFPLMVGLAALANPIINILLTDKWIGVVLLLQILCLDWMFDHITSINLNLLWVKGRSDLSLKLEFIKKTIAIIILFLSIPWGVEGMCWGRVFYSLIATYLNTTYTKKLISLSFSQQIKDITPSLVLAFLMGGCIYCLNSFIPSFILQLICGFILGVIFYLSLAYLFKIQSFNDILCLIKKNKSN